MDRCNLDLTCRGLCSTGWAVVLVEQVLFLLGFILSDVAQYRVAVHVLVMEGQVLFWELTCQVWRSTGCGTPPGEMEVQLLFWE